MDAKIKKLFEAKKIKHKLLEHRKVYTAFNSAETQHADVKQVVKTVLVKLGKSVLIGLYEADAVLVCVPSGKRLDLKKISKTIKTTVKLGKEKDIEKKLKTKVGLLHPFGSIFKLPVLLDNKLGKNKKLLVSAGSYTESLEINTKDYLKVESPLLGNFT